MFVDKTQANVGGGQGLLRHIIKIKSHKIKTFNAATRRHESKDDNKMKTRPSQRLREKEQKGQQRKQNRVTNIEICVSTADEEDMDMARWQTPNRHRLINAWKMQQLPELDNSRHFQPASQAAKGNAKSIEKRGEWGERSDPRCAVGKQII